MSLREQLQSIIRPHPQQDIAVAVRDWSAGRAVDLKARRSFHAASTVKLPVMIEVFRQAEANQLSLDDALVVHNAFASAVDGAPRYAVEADSDEVLHAHLGRPVPIRVLVRRMITASSNLAANLLLERVTPEAVQATLERLGAEGMHVRRGVEDLAAYRRGLNNTTTAAALATLLRALAEEKAMSPAADRTMRAILRAQQFTGAIPAGLPPGIPVAHKTGWTSSVQHDAALVEPPGADPYVLVVLTEGFETPGRAKEVIARIARTVHEALRT